MEKLNSFILLADDDADDLQLLSEVFQKIDTRYIIIQVNNGLEALSQLEEMKQQGKLPCLIVLDINMPLMDGKKTLVALQNDAELKNIPVVIFTTSNSDTDKLFCRNKNVEMITKPDDFKNLYSVAIKMLNYCRT